MEMVHMLKWALEWVGAVSLAGSRRVDRPRSHRHRSIPHCVAQPGRRHCCHTIRGRDSRSVRSGRTDDSDTHRCWCTRGDSWAGVQCSWPGTSRQLVFRSHGKSSWVHKVRASKDSRWYDPHVEHNLRLDLRSCLAHSCRSDYD